VNRRNHKSIFRLAAASLLLVAPAHGQTLTLLPSCGKVGTSVCITGSGWAEPNPVCRYTFKFNGSTVAPDQPDGLYGPPSTKFNVPNVADGNYTVHVELRLNSPDNLLQQRDQTFKVVSNIPNPYTPAPGNTFGGVATFTATFDPNNVCDAGPCKNIRFIQIIQMRGRLSADPSKTRQLTFAEQGFPQSAKYDADVTPAGWVVDVTVGNPDPYYQHPIPGKALSGNTSPNVPATMGDYPTRQDAHYPADIDRIILNFEVAVFCVDGDLKGRFLGTLRWTWTRDRGGTATVTLGGGDRNQPSQALVDALTKWNTNHSYTNKFPQPTVQNCIY
jgi:hypothetical protein